MAIDIPTTTAPPPAAEQPSRLALEAILLAVAHRLGSAALILLIIGVAMIGRLPFHWHLLPAAFGLGLLGFLAGFLAWFFIRRRRAPAGEARNAAIFCAAVTLAAFMPLALVRMEVIAS